MATERKLRKDTAADLVSVTPVEAEPGYDRTNKRLLVGDNARAEGIPHPNFWDLQNQTFVFCAAPGSSNSPADGDDMTFDIADGTLDYNPTAYTAGLRVAWKQAIANTGAVTIDIDGLGPKTVKKNAGADDLAAGDLQVGGLYEATYDGTNLQLGGTAGASGLPAADFESLSQTVTNNVLLSLAHGLGATPTLVQAWLRCTSADLEYSVGDRVQVGTTIATGTATDGALIGADSTNVLVRSLTLGLPRKSTDSAVGLNTSKWVWDVYAWA